MAASPEDRSLKPLGDRGPGLIRHSKAGNRRKDATQLELKSPSAVFPYNRTAPRSTQQKLVGIFPQWSGAAAGGTAHSPLPPAAHSSHMARSHWSRAWGTHCSPILSPPKRTVAMTAGPLPPYTGGSDGRHLARRPGVLGRLPPLLGAAGGGARRPLPPQAEQPYQGNQEEGTNRGRESDNEH